jgi:hypothetical protein
LNSPYSYYNFGLIQLKPLNADGIVTILPSLLPEWLKLMPREGRWHKIFKVWNMREKETDNHRVVTPEPPQVMDPSKPPVNQGKEKKDGSGTPREKEKKRDKRQEKPKQLKTP